MALLLALLSSLCFGIALVTGRVGLRTLAARSGAAISIPAATLLLAAAAPFVLQLDGFSVQAALVFAVVGLFFPAVVTLLTFRSNEQLGPTVTSAVSGTAPLFALLAAGIFLGERIPAQAAAATVAVVAGVGLLSWKQGAVRPGFTGRSLLWPVSGAVVRGLAQVGVKAGLLLWPSAFAASLIGYVVSSATVVTVNRLGDGARPKPTKRGIGWFAVTGILNGSAVLLMYGALSIAPVSLVAPLVATYPLVTALVSAAVLRDEPLTARMLAGAIVIVAAIVALIVSTGDAEVGVLEHLLPALHAGRSGGN
jgi:drug/metabolite transporter (DMT)-like permease